MTIPALLTRIPSGRTFGIELEFYGLSYREVKETLDKAGVSCYMDGDIIYNCDFDTEEEEEAVRTAPRVGWKITDDGSIDNDDGDPVELVSPVLKGIRGLREVAKVAQALKRAGAQVNDSCGFHVHVGAGNLTGATFINLVKRYAAYESVMDSFMTANRRLNENEYCRSLSGMLDRMNRLSGSSTPTQVANRFSHSDYDHRYGVSSGGRYYKVNLCSFLRHGTVEFRHHNGTMEAAKIVNWIVFCLSFVKNSEESHTKPAFAGVPRPTREFYQHA